MDKPDIFEVRRMCSKSGGLGSASVEMVELESGRWAPANYCRLLNFIHSNGLKSAAYDPDKPPYAVFDWDQTCIFNDTEEELFRFQIKNLLFKMTPGEFSEVIRKNVPPENFSCSYKNLNGDSLNIETVAADLDAAYTWLYKHYRGFGSGGEMSLEEVRKSEYFIDFRAKLAWLYDAISGTFSSEVSYPWLLYFFSGMTPEEVKLIAEKSNDAAMADDIGVCEFTSSKTLVTGAGQISKGGYRTGLRIIPEMCNLMDALRSNGIHVYVCSASLDNVVCVFAGLSKYGYSVPEENVLGMRLAAVNGKYIAEYDASWVYTHKAGKTEAIKRVLVAKYGYGPALVCGDSQGDYNMAVDFDDTQLVLMINRLSDDDLGKLSLSAIQTLGSPDAKFILQGRDENLGVFRPDEKTIKFGKYDPELLHSIFIKK